MAGRPSSVTSRLAYSPGMGANPCLSPPLSRSRTSTSDRRIAAPAPTFLQVPARFSGPPEACRRAGRMADVSNPRTTGMQVWHDDAGALTPAVVLAADGDAPVERDHGLDHVVRVRGHHALTLQHFAAGFRRASVRAADQMADSFNDNSRLPAGPRDSGNRTCIPNRCRPRTHNRSTEWTCEAPFLC